MADLAQVLDKASIREAVKPEVASVRHGWATKQVVAALQNADGPLSTTDVRRAIAERTGHEIGHSTVRYILRYGSWAKSGRIVNSGSAKYELA